MLGSMVVLVSCARQLYQPSREIPPSAGTQIRVALDDNLQSATLIFNDEYRLKSEEALYILDQSIGEFTVESSKHQLIFRSERREFVFKDFQTVQFRTSGYGRFVWNGIPYQGEIQFIEDGDKVVVVNTLPLPSYLRGVVPYEIPSQSEDYYQAVAAQTVAARTYAVYHLQHPATELFQVFADTRDQVYLGLQKSSDLANQAIEETAGQVLADSAGEVIETQYHSTCGGLLEVRNAYYPAPVNPIRNDSLQGSFNCVGSPLYRWIKKIDTRIILHNLERLGYISPQKSGHLKENGFTMDLSVLSRSPSGRIETLSIKVNDQNFALRDYQIRVALGNDQGEILPSNLFFLKSSPRNSRLLYIIGAGYGHGFGMCQWGAIGMALKGQSYRDILKFYYPALHIKIPTII